MCDVVVSNTWAPQGTVQSPFMFTLYTSDFQCNSESCHLQKLSDVTIVNGRVKGEQESEYRELSGNFVEWLGKNHLLLNVSNTKRAGG